MKGAGKLPCPLFQIKTTSKKMKDIILQRWAQTNNKELGDSLRAFTIQLIREGGLTYVGTCPEDNLCLPSGPTLTTAQILAAIELINDRLTALENP